MNESCRNQAQRNEVRRAARAAAVAVWPGWAAALCPAAAAACDCYCCACGFIIYPALRERSRECGWCARAEQPRCRCTMSLLRCWLAVDDAVAAMRVPCSSYACSIDAALRRALRRASAAELIVPRARLSAQDTVSSMRCTWWACDYVLYGASRVPGPSFELSRVLVWSCRLPCGKMYSVMRLQ